MHKKCYSCAQENHVNCTARSQAMALCKGEAPLEPACWCDCPGLAQARQALIDKHDLVVR